MARVKKSARKAKVPQINLEPGMVFLKKNSVYTKQMIISDTVHKLSSGLYRECVAWNEERCRRYDTKDSELYGSELVGRMDLVDLKEYVRRNCKDEWGEPSIPKYTEEE